MTMTLAALLGGAVAGAWIGLALWWPRGFRPLWQWGETKRRREAVLWKLKGDGNE